jgi:hypothetical protein
MARSAVAAAAHTFKKAFIVRKQEQKMAHWKRLTGLDGTMIDVNMDNVAYIHPQKEQTGLYFIGGQGDEGKILRVSVKEAPDEIHMGDPLHFV